MKGGGVGLYGRPRPVPLAPTSSEKGFFIGGGERQFMGGSSENCYFHAGWCLPHIKYACLLKSGRRGEKRWLRAREASIPKPKEPALRLLASLHQEVRAG